MIASLIAVAIIVALTQFSSIMQVLYELVQALTEAAIG
jgi:hypothetical protein